MTDPVVAEEMTEEKENVKMAEEEEETTTVPKPSEHDAVADGSSAGTKRPADAQDVGSVEESEEEQQEMEEVDDGSKGEENEEELDEGTAARSNDEPIKPKTSIDITKRPVKRARSAYFVFADEQRAKVKEQVSGVAVRFGALISRMKLIEFIACVLGFVHLSSITTYLLLILFHDTILTEPRARRGSCCACTGANLEQYVGRRQETLLRHGSGRTRTSSSGSCRLEGRGWG